MRFRTKGDRLSRGYRRTRYPEDGSQKDTRSSRLVPANYCHGSTPISRIYRVLSILHSELLQDCPTTLGSHKKDNPMALGSTPVHSIRNPEDSHVPKTRSTPTKLRKTILPPNRRFRIWRGRHTLASGRA